jgi:hypothetical protein
VDYSLETGAEVLRSSPYVLGALLLDHSDGWLHGREASEAWSPYQVCGHLLHIEQNDWIDRTRVILERPPEHEFEPVDREAGFTAFAGWSLVELLDSFAETRRANLATVSQLVRDADLDRRGRHPTFGEVTLRQLLATWVAHDLNHLNQIVKTMAKEYGDAVGPWRAFLPVIDAP